MLRQRLQANFQGFKDIFRKPKLHNDKLPTYLQLKYTFIPLLILVIFAYYNLDTPVENYIKRSMPSVVGVIFGKITDVGKAEYILIICGVIVLARLFSNSEKLSTSARTLFNKVSAHAGFILATVAISGILGQILKMIIGRARPKFFLEYGSHYFQHFHAPGYDFASMPSGHSITVGAMFIAFFYIFPKLRYLWYVLIVIFAGSRIIVGSHYPSDVIFGVVFGCYCTAYIYYWMKNREIT
ncbi:phosphatase [Francisella persica ATCC VR-331]|uniref:undecaprenyl-diphosphate phosphatase n=1 Tax=Francisella persica ATCC VR-331 TaxID=1086726 RepID=A0AAC8VDQ8_9GAMM|nr:lipid A 1-phosphatase LpxE [Francisella persica]ALB01943.1 phosphatase [Francisella persica ATCC VR-331]ANH77197.1 phosphatase [Francisella persica ATCC VR-331]